MAQAPWKENKSPTCDLQKEKESQYARRSQNKKFQAAHLKILNLKNDSSIPLSLPSSRNYTTHGHKIWKCPVGITIVFPCK